MPYRTSEFVTGKFYHVVTKARTGLKAFYCERDYCRFLSMVEKYMVNRVDVRVFGFVKNHGHFLIGPIRDDGLEKFMQILQSQYSRSLRRPGNVFIQPFWAKPILDDDQYYYTMMYILRNPGKHKVVNLGRDGKSGVFSVLPRA